MDVSFKAKSLVVSLILTLAIFGWYLVAVFSSFPLDQEPPSFVTLLVLVVWFAVFESLIHSLLAIKHPSQREDERDKLIERLAQSYAYWFLCGCLFFVMGNIVMASWLGLSSTHLVLNLVGTPNGIFHLLLLCFVSAEVVNFVTQLYHHRVSL